ncbi:MAG: membrane-bound lytic murein transglycosylase D, partial [Halioglobus sp.]
MKLRTLIIVFSTSFILFGCGTLETDLLGKSAVTPVIPLPAPLAAAALINAEQAPEIQPPVADVGPEDLWLRIREQLSFHTIEHTSVVAARKHYMRQTNYMPHVSQRAAPYLFYVVSEVEKRGMPVEIALLPIVESTYNPFALSSAHASGLWQ